MPVALFEAVEGRVIGAFNGGMMELKGSSELSPQRILEVGLGFWASKTLLSAIELRLFTELARQPGDLDSIQRRLRLHPRSARDFLDSLVAMGFLKRDAEGVYRNMPETELFLDKQKPSYVGG